MEKLELLEKQLQQKACPLPEQPPQPQQRQKRRTKRNVYPLENAYTDTFNDEIGAMEFMRNFMEVKYDSAWCAGERWKNGQKYFNAFDIFLLSAATDWAKKLQKKIFLKIKKIICIFAHFFSVQRY